MSLKELLEKEVVNDAIALTRYAEVAKFVDLVHDMQVRYKDDKEEEVSEMEVALRIFSNPITENLIAKEFPFMLGIIKSVVMER